MPDLLEAAIELGLTPDEYRRIVDLLGRHPNHVELGMFSVMWSEHCCYKSSIVWLKKLPRSGPRLLAEAGEENAGLVDIGGGWAVAFKIESHNHPSAIAPYQGAATGVGGIHRDIFTTGARPIAALDSLHFGPPDQERSHWHLEGVVEGIGGYGNCIGIPTVGGECWFDESYATNPIVNAMSVGVVRTDRIVSAAARTPGARVFIVGSATGKDGIHGAAFASGDLKENAEEDLPAVQVGDPFMGKKLLEAVLEANEAGCIDGMQDMGAAGISCSTLEMAEKGGHGMEVHLDAVPLRQPDMTPFEILLSESQERMLIVAVPGKEDALCRIFEKWEVPCTEIGRVRQETDNIYYWHGEVVAEVPPRALVLGGDAPVYERPARRPDYVERIARFNADAIPKPDDLRAVAECLTAHPNIRSKRWIFEQYDREVMTHNLSEYCPSDAAVVLEKHTGKALALTTDCNPYHVFAAPRRGTQMAVAEAARNIVCSGGTPVAVTNCLNFGNPLYPEVFWQFKEAVLGMKDACEAFQTPVTGGNVSFYNQSENGEPILPTPVIGMVGVLEDPAWHMGLAFQQPGDLIYEVGFFSDAVEGSQYVIHYYGQRLTPPPPFRLENEVRFQAAVRALLQRRERPVRSVHDISEGGLWVTLLESALPRGMGFSVRLPSDGRPDGWLFGEAAPRAVMSVPPSQAKEFEAHWAHHRIGCRRLGEVTDGRIVVDGADWGTVEQWRAYYEKGF